MNLINCGDSFQFDQDRTAHNQIDSVKRNGRVPVFHDDRIFALKWNFIRL